MVDFGDVEAMAGLRARVLGVLQLLSAASSLLGVFTVPAFRESGAAPYAISFDLVVGLWALWRGKRMGDLSFLGLLVAAQAVAGSYLCVVFPAGSVVPVEYGLLCPTIIAAVFSTRRWQVVVQAISVMAITGWLASVRVAAGPALTQTVFGEVFTFTVVVVVVRLLRDVAYDALTVARRGELTDPLTGLSNRRGLERHGRGSWQSQARRRLPIAVLIVDIDRFKRVNDLQGHAAGDEVIRRVAQLLTAGMRQDDITVRLGGEEFLVLAAAVPGEGLSIAERLRETIARELAPITVSIGVYETIPQLSDTMPDTLWNAVNIADHALYAAKRSGRNRVVSPRSQLRLG